MLFRSLFLRKWTKTETERITEQKATLQTTIKNENKYMNMIEVWNKEKKRIIKEHVGFVNTTGETEKKKIEATAEFKSWKTDINTDYTQKINDLKDELSEQYQIRKAQTLADYPIFMAIAEDISYDATGKPTGNNELDIIGEELGKFINSIEDNEL